MVKPAGAGFRPQLTYRMLLEKLLCYLQLGSCPCEWYPHLLTLPRPDVQELEVWWLLSHPGLCHRHVLAYSKAEAMAAVTHS